MGAGYVAMLTAFYVNNGPRLPWGTTAGPGVLAAALAIGAPIIARAVMHARRASPMSRTRQGI